jgi:hypothetical protein
MKNKAGKVIGFEKLNFLPQSEQPVEVAFKSLFGIDSCSETSNAYGGDRSLMRND